jgi:hypothetical protein
MDEIYSANDPSVAPTEPGAITWKLEGTGLDGDCALSVAAASEYQVYAVGCDNQVYQWSPASGSWSAFERQPSAGASQVSVDSNGYPWVIDNTSHAVWGFY